MKQSHFAFNLCFNYFRIANLLPVCIMWRKQWYLIVTLAPQETTFGSRIEDI